MWQIGQLVRAKNTGLRRKLSRSVLMPWGIARPVCGAFDHDHTHVSLPSIWFEARNRPVGLCLLSVRLLGGHRTCPLFDRARGRMLVAGLVPTGRVALLDEPWM